MKFNTYMDKSIQKSQCPYWEKLERDVAGNFRGYYSINSSGNPVIVANDDANAAQIDTWIEWIIPLQVFEDQGINLTNVDRIAIGLRTRGNMAILIGSGKMYINDNRQCQSRTAPQK